MDRVKVAIIGAGRMAEEHARVYAALPDAELVGIFSRTRSRAEDLAQRFGIPAVHDSVAGLAGTGADLVLVTVSELGMLPTVEEAVRHDWTLFLEKPAGYTEPIAAEVRRAVHDRGRRAYVGLNRRYYAAVTAAQEALSGSDSPRYIVVNDQQSLAESRAVGHPEEVVQAMMYANSIHLVDYLRVFGRGGIEKVDRLADWKGEDTFLQSATVFFSSGDIGRYDALWQAPGPWSCTVTSREKRLEMRPLETLTSQAAGTRRPVPVELDPIDQQYKAGFYRQAEDMLRAARGEPSRMPTIDDAFETMRLVSAVYGIQGAIPPSAPLTPAKRAGRAGSSLREYYRPPPPASAAPASNWSGVPMSSHWPRCS